MRSLSSEFLGALYDPETDEAIVCLVTFDHEALTDGPIRASNHNTTRLSDDPLRYGTVSRGQTFDYFPFSITLPDEAEDALPTIQLTIENISRELTPILSSITTPATVLVEIVTAGHPDEVEMAFPDFELRSAEIDAGRAVLSLSLDALSDEPYPGDNFTPGRFGALWSSV